MDIYFDSKKGTRKTNQDRHTIITNIKVEQENVIDCNLFGIYDGHGEDEGGDFVADFISKNLPPFFSHEKIKLPLSKNYINKVYNKVEEVLEKKHPKQSRECGSTCLLVLYYTLEIDGNNKSFINVLNTGDSRLVLCRDYIGNNITKDHKPDSILEKSRIINNGGENRLSYGYVCRIDDLSLSRAFGDNVSKDLVIHTPDFFIKKINKKRDSFMILACDGLWDVFGADEACEYVLNRCYDLIDLKRDNKNSINIASELCKEAINRECHDNVSIIVVFFD